MAKSKKSLQEPNIQAAINKAFTDALSVSEKKQTLKEKMDARRERAEKILSKPKRPNHG